MRRWLVTIAVAALFVAPLRADLTITTTTSVEGGMAAAGGGAGPKVVTRIKGNKSRTEVEVGGQVTSTIVDLATKQTIILRSDDKTAQIVDPGAASAPPVEAMPLPAIHTSVKPTGQKRDINGAQCEEYAVTIKMDMAPLAAGRGGTMPPEAAAMLKDLKMNMTGSAWVARNAPGAAEF